MAAFPAGDGDRIKFTQKQQRILDYIYMHADAVPVLSIDQLARELDIGVATLSRLVRKLGFDSFKDMKLHLIGNNEFSPDVKMHNTISGSEADPIAQTLVREANFLLKTRDNVVQADIDRAIAAIRTANVVYIFGKGAAESIASLTAFRLNRFGIRTVIFKTGGSEIFETLVNVTRSDLLIVFGFHKMPVEARTILTHSREVGFKTIVFTDLLLSDDSRRGDINLYVCRGSAQDYHSMAAPIALVDAMIIQMAKEMQGESLRKLEDLYRLKEKYSRDIRR